MNNEIKKVIDRVKTAQSQLQTLLKSQEWMDEAKKYAERQGKEVRKLITSDVGKVRLFLENERKELERFQKQIPGEVKKFRKFVTGQRKEIERLLANVRKAGGTTTSTGKKRTTPKSTASRTRSKAAPAAPSVSE